MINKDGINILKTKISYISSDPLIYHLEIKTAHILISTLVHNYFNNELNIWFFFYIYSLNYSKLNKTN